VHGSIGVAKNARSIGEPKILHTIAEHVTAEKRKKSDTNMDLFDSEKYPALARLTGVLLTIWPQHSGFIRKSLPSEDESSLVYADELASMIDRVVAGKLEQLSEDYRWTCEQLLEEELHFRRTGAYRLSSFAEAQREVYGDSEFMGRYVNGLLLSHLYWSNHRRVFRSYSERFLPRLPADFQHLEIGPGHGLYLALAATHPMCASATGWDVSETSTSQTLNSLERLGVKSSVDVEQLDVLEALDVDKKFDSIVISEVLEHLENPDLALSNLRQVMLKDGFIFVNMPVNSPAPDHIYLLQHPSEVSDLVARNGFDILETEAFPATGYSAERAHKYAATISCVITATPAL
jgi:2-polyprenyl-3-methyl-5-hydroxy-6-metoxy-1,4-benzoquinol methylase